MTCPHCGCKVHYEYNEEDFDTDLERCAACGEIFNTEDALEDDGDSEA